MKENLPYIPLNVDAFLADDKVALMNTQEVGAYILLLCRAWQQKQPGTLPSNDEWLARWARLDLDQWLKIKQVVMSPFWFNESYPGGEWVQDRMARDHSSISSTQQKKRELAKKAANARWGNQIQDQDEREMDETPEPTDALHLHGKSKKVKPKTKILSWTVEDGFCNIQEKHWKAWKEAFPSVDLEQQMKEAHVWLVDRPDKRYKKYSSFLTRWFKRSIEFAKQSKGLNNGSHKRESQHEEIGLGKEVNFHGS